MSDETKKIPMPEKVWDAVRRAARAVHIVAPAPRPDAQALGENVVLLRARRAAAKDPWRDVPALLAAIALLQRVHDEWGHRGSARNYQVSWACGAAARAFQDVMAKDYDDVRAKIAEEAERRRRARERAAVTPLKVV